MIAHIGIYNNGFVVQGILCIIVSGC